MRRLKGKAEIEAYRTRQAEKQRQPAQRTEATQARPQRAEASRELPSWDSIKHLYPEGSIVHPDLAGRELILDGKRYIVANPPRQTREGWVYIPENSGHAK